MVNKKVMLAKSVGKTPPEAGYWFAKLTIGFEEKLAWYGYTAAIGNLEPKGNVDVIATMSLRGGVTVCTDTNNKPIAFYYKGKKYKDAGEDKDLFSEWKNMVGKTVDVWIGGGG